MLTNTKPIRISSISTSKENHPSQQTQSLPYKPQIKVGYKVIAKEETQKRCRKMVAPINKEQRAEKGVRKMVDLKQKLSGAFIGDEYVKQQNTERQSRYSRKGVKEVHQKYHAGTSITNELKQQNFNAKQIHRSQSSSAVLSTQRSLPSQEPSGMKQIMEYKYAGPFRQVPVTDKCTKQNVKSRCLKFSDWHEFDFRKRIR